MSANEELMQEELNDDDYEEEWVAVVNKAKYDLSKDQALIVKQAMATGERGNVVFDSFVICIPFVSEFYRVRRFLKNAKLLTSKATEEEFIPMDPQKWEEFKKKVYAKVGKPMSNEKKGAVKKV